MFRNKLSPVWESYCWWENHRLKYNKGLVLSGFTAFLLYAVLGEMIIAPHEDFEVTLFTTYYQGVAYLVVMLIANACFYLGWLADIIFNQSNDEEFRKNLYSHGYWFSALLPVVLILYLMACKYLNYR